MSSENDLVHIASAGNTGEASVMRSFLECHDVDVLVSGENSHSALGMAGFIELRIMVPAQQTKLAKGLLAEYKNDAEVEVGPNHREPFRDEFDNEEEAEAMEGHRNDASRRLAKRIALKAALAFPMGGGHFITGAILRGLLLAFASVYGIAQGSETPAFFGLWAAAVVVDIYGSQKRVANGRRGTSPKS